MTVAEKNEIAESAEPRVRRWTREEYYQLADLGIFQDQRVELIDGEIMQMAPQKVPHTIAIGLLERELSRLFGKGYWVRTQMPLFFMNDSEPEPDIAIVPGGPRDYVTQDHPRMAVLIVEVSEATLRYDRTRKASLYAAAGIEDYWNVNLIDRQLEVHRNRIADASQKFGWRYQNVTIVKPSDSFSPIVLPDVKVAVKDILP